MGLLDKFDVLPLASITKKEKGSLLLFVIMFLYFINK